MCGRIEACYLKEADKNARKQEGKEEEEKGKHFWPPSIAQTHLFADEFLSTRAPVLRKSVDVR